MPAGSGPSGSVLPSPAPDWLGRCVFRLLDARRLPAVPAPSAPQKLPWTQNWRFDLSYWYILGLHVLYAAVFFPFRQTYAIEYFQHAKGLTLQQAGSVNAGVFAAAIVATPFFGLLADRVGHRALMLVAGTLLLPVTFAILGFTSLNPWISTALMGVSWALVPAVIWPSTTLLVEPKRLGLALGIITLLQNVGLWSSNRFAGWLADAAGAVARIRPDTRRCCGLRLAEPACAGLGPASVAA